MGTVTAKQRGKKTTSAMCKQQCLHNQPEKGPFLIIEKTLKNPKQPSSRKKTGCGN